MLCPNLTGAGRRIMWRTNFFIPRLLLTSKFAPELHSRIVNFLSSTAASLHPIKFKLPRKKSDFLNERQILENTDVSGYTNRFESPLKKSGNIAVNEITKEIHYCRDSSNNFKDATYIDTDAPYGPPLAILLLWLSPEQSAVGKFVEWYGSKGFDVLTVRLDKHQLLFPRKDCGAIRMVSSFLDYLNGSHRYRPYIVHGFSTGVYFFGEMMAQVAEQFETYYTIVENIKGCLWDSPVEFSAAAPVAGRALYPRNFVKRWFFDRAMTRHFSQYQRDSVDCWERSREHFCRQKCKVPNLFFLSENDPLSNPATVEAARIVMEQNGIPTYQKTWPGTKHLDNFNKYVDEYVHGMSLFFSLASLFPDPYGKYHSYSTNAHLTSIRLNKKVRSAV